MLVMIQSDFITMKNSLVQLTVLCALVAVLISISTETLIGGVAAVAAMIPFMYIFSITAYDEMNGWERFRLTLPINRRQVVFGRYVSIIIVVLLSDVLAIAFYALIALLASVAPVIPGIGALANSFEPVRGMGQILLVSSVILIAATFAMPLFMRFGLTKGSRVAPLLIVVLLIGAMYIAGDSEEVILNVVPMLEVLVQPGLQAELATLGICACVFAAVLALYVISALIATRLYAKRQF